MIKGQSLWTFFVTWVTSLDPVLFTVLVWARISNVCSNILSGSLIGSSSALISTLIVLSLLASSGISSGFPLIDLQLFTILLLSLMVPYKRCVINTKRQKIIVVVKTVIKYPPIIQWNRQNTVEHILTDTWRK